MWNFYPLNFESNSHLILNYVNLDSEYVEYVELAPDDEINHKDKLKAVVTPLLVTPAESASGEQSSD